MDETKTPDATTEETKVDAPVEATETTEETKKSTEAKEDVDYKAKFEAEEKLRKKAEGKVQYLKESQKPTESADEAVDKSLDEEAISEIVRQGVRQELGGIRQEMNSEKIDSAIRAHAVNEDHFNLVKYHYENSLSLTGNLDNDIDNAFALAGKKQMREQLENAKRAMKSKETKDTVSQDATQPSNAGGAPNTSGLSAGLKKQIANGTFKYNPKNKRFETTAGVWFQTDSAGNKVASGREDN